MWRVAKNTPRTLWSLALPSDATQWEHNATQMRWNAPNRTHSEIFSLLNMLIFISHLHQIPVWRFRWKWYKKQVHTFFQIHGYLETLKESSEVISSPSSLTRTKLSVQHVSRVFSSGPFCPLMVPCLSLIPVLCEVYRKVVVKVGDMMQAAVHWVYASLFIRVPLHHNLPPQRGLLLWLTDASY